MSKLGEELKTWAREGKESWQITAQGIDELQLAADTPYKEYFQAVKELIVNVWKFSLWLETDPELKKVSWDELQESDSSFNYQITLEKNPEGEIPYDTCLGNPDYAVQLYGTEMGQLLCMLYYQYKAYKTLVIQQSWTELSKYNKLYLIMLNHARNNRAVYHHWLDLARLIVLEDIDEKILYQMYWSKAPDNTYFKDIVMKADFQDLRYLFRFGIPVSQVHVDLAKFILAYPEEELKKLSKYIVQSYLDGFIRNDKDYRRKKYTNLIFPLGMEKLGRMLIKDLYDSGLYAIVQQPIGKSINKQFLYDHRFDSALYLDQHYKDKIVAASEQAADKMAGYLSQHAGPIYIQLFGETPFVPNSKNTTLTLSKEQQELNKLINSKNSQAIYKYYKSEEVSFCIIAFPSPEIGVEFPELFAETVKINLLDSLHYSKIQQKIIDVLDMAEYVEVIGKPGNETNIRVKLHPLKNPELETNFENCVADVNIPVGEVFTSPLLSGTNGTLHVEDIYLNGLRFYNLKLTFTDGMVTDYSCTNFDTPETNKKFVHENLLLPHDTLPIGEFAIGTNTTAYKIAKKYDILSKLPILIIEKMGPHFAIGDTCYSREEDKDHFNFVNGKKIIAVENEKTALRHEDYFKAYTQKHCDITLPYEMLQSITAIKADGSRIDIIRNGRFVVSGTEELNIPLDELEGS